MRTGKRFLAEAGIMTVFSLLAIFTALNHNWIEHAFNVDLDPGSGRIEWPLVAVPALAMPWALPGRTIDGAKHESRAGEQKNG